MTPRSQLPCSTQANPQHCRRLIRTSLLILLATALVLPLATPLRAAETTRVRELRQEINVSERKARETREEVAKLSAQERRMHSDLADMEKRLERMTGTLKAREQRLLELQRRELELEVAIADLGQQRDRSAAELKRLLEHLWPIQSQSLADRLRGVEDWSQADRSFTWLAAIYAQARAQLAETQQRTAQLTAAVTEVEAARQRVEEELTRVDAAKDELLAGRLAMLKRLREVRTRQEEAQESLDSIMRAVSSLNLRLNKALTPPPGPRMPAPDVRPPAAEAPSAYTPVDEAVVPHGRGTLPWPARGKLVARFAPGANPPNRGLGLALADANPINAIGLGRVVHNDVLRGFGRVVVLVHDNALYSLYAFLGDTSVRVGQQVQAGQMIGRAGFYPPAKGPGLYFELRSGQKPVNPLDWLTP